MYCDLSIETTRSQYVSFPFSSLIESSKRSIENIRNGKFIGTKNNISEYFDQVISCTKIMDYVRIEKIIYNEFVLQLESPILLEVRCENGYYIIEHPESGIFVAERSFNDAVLAFNEEFVYIWHEYAEEVDENLSKDALILKKWLLEKVKRV